MGNCIKVASKVDIIQELKIYYKFDPIAKFILDTNVKKFEHIPKIEGRLRDSPAKLLVFCGEAKSEIF